MKKKMNLLISSIMALCLAACGADNTGSNQSDIDSTSAVSSEPATENAAAAVLRNVSGEKDAGALDASGAADTEGGIEMTGSEVVTGGKLPEELVLIPQDYFAAAEQQGTLVELYYDTFESMAYGQQATVIHKRAIVYLPYGYSGDMQYNVFYLMHGGWSDETAYLGTPDNPGGFKNVLDHPVNYGNSVHNSFPQRTWRHCGENTESCTGNRGIIRHFYPGKHIGQRQVRRSFGSIFRRTKVTQEENDE